MTQPKGADACELKQVDTTRRQQSARGSTRLLQAVRSGGPLPVLGDSTRARILLALLEAGESACVPRHRRSGEDAGVDGVAIALRLLRTAGIVRNRRAGRMIHYSLDDAHVRMLLDLSLTHLRHGEVDR